MWHCYEDRRVSTKLQLDMTPIACHLQRPDRVDAAFPTSNIMRPDSPTDIRSFCSVANGGNVGRRSTDRLGSTPSSRVLSNQARELASTIPFIYRSVVLATHYLFLHIACLQVPKPRICTGSDKSVAESATASGEDVHRVMWIKWMQHMLSGRAHLRLGDMMLEDCDHF